MIRFLEWLFRPRTPIEMPRAYVCRRIRELCDAEHPRTRKKGEPMPDRYAYTPTGNFMIRWECRGCGLAEDRHAASQYTEYCDACEQVKQWERDLQRSDQAD